MTGVVMEGITKQQIKAIWALAHRAGLNDRRLHARVESSYGKPSIRDLTKPEAARLIADLQPTEGAERPSSHAEPNRKGAITRAQMVLIEAFGRRIGWDTDRLARLARRMYGVVRLIDLQTRQASGLIEALKAIQHRHAA